MYFTLTILSSVGYGDMVPLNNFERVYILLFQWIGIFFFSYIMGQLGEIILNYKDKMGVVDHTNQLEQWVTSFKRFRKEDLPISLLLQVETDLKYLWEQDLLKKSEIESQKSA